MTEKERFILAEKFHKFAIVIFEIINKGKAIEKTKIQSSEADVTLFRNLLKHNIIIVTAGTDSRNIVIDIYFDGEFGTEEYGKWAVDPFEYAIGQGFVCLIKNLFAYKPDGCEDYIAALLEAMITEANK